QQGWRTVAIPLDSVAAVELDCVHDKRSSGGQNPVVTHRYHCDVSARWRKPGGGEEKTLLVQTSETDEPERPYRDALPLATELAEALGVERRVSDYRA